VIAFLRRRVGGPRLRTARLAIRPLEMDDGAGWTALRRDSEAFLTPWEPAWARDHLSAAAFRERVRWAGRAIAEGRAFPLVLERLADRALVGSITIDNIRRGPSMSATVGYWMGAAFARQGYMTEALGEARAWCFRDLGLSRLEAACLPENAPSRALLERCGFKYEGVAQSYLQIAGRWRTHVLYAALREDRRGRVGDAG
jgi:ribosomal-protein-alanine N-acetyltransferase